MPQLIVGIVGVRENKKFREQTPKEFELYEKILKDLPSNQNMVLKFLCKSEDDSILQATILTYKGKIKVDGLTMPLYITFDGDNETKDKKLGEILDLKDGIKKVDMRYHPLNNAVDYKISLRKTKKSYTIDIYPSCP